MMLLCASVAHTLRDIENANFKRIRCTQKSTFVPKWSRKWRERWLSNEHILSYSCSHFLFVYRLSVYTVSMLLASVELRSVMKASEYMYANALCPRWRINIYLENERWQWVVACVRFDAALALMVDGWMMVTTTATAWKLVIGCQK